AELLGGQRRVGQQPGGIGRPRVAALAALDDGGEARQDLGEAAHAAMSVRRTAMPAAAIACFTSPMETSPKWKIEAASTASAPPSRTASTMCCAPPAPPEAITGTETAADTAFSSARS